VDQENYMSFQTVGSIIGRQIAKEESHMPDKKPDCSMALVEALARVTDPE
jgi:hypothetical protein